MTLAVLFLEVLRANVAAGRSSGVTVNLTVSDILMIVNALGMFGNIALSFRGKK